MYLDEIHYIDKRWPEYDTEWQDFLHKILIYSKLVPYIHEIGVKKYKKYTKILKFCKTMELTIKSKIKLNII